MSADGNGFHKVNIHERRFAAWVCRAFPLSFVMTVFAVCIYGAMKKQVVLLAASAFFNVALWLWVVCTALISIFAAVFKLDRLDHVPLEETAQPIVPSAETVTHLIVLPNYKEEEDMLAETLRSLTEADGSSSFWILLAMEAREGEAGAERARHLKEQFSAKFARILISNHPADLKEYHQDGSENSEVPGKASNVKYAVNQAYAEVTESLVSPDSVVLTVADADCIFHPRYFHEVGKEFQELRRNGEHQRTLWQAPQFPYRNYYTSPIVSRAWAYVASVYEFGGLSSILFSGQHLLFSSYSLPLLLAHSAQAWDGDVVAEDHHAWLKCLFYSMGDNSHKHNSPITLKPIFLPVKSTSVESQNYWAGWVERWSQAKRHAQGVAEFSYALLVTWDALMTWTMTSEMLMRMSQVLVRLFCIHLLPHCQALCLGILTLKWLYNHESLSKCPDRLQFFGPTGDFLGDRYLLCGLAGAWVLTWPVVVPFVLCVISNYLILYKCFLRPAVTNRYRSVWHADDGKVPHKNSSPKVLLLILFDFIFGLSWIMFLYAFCAEVIAYFNVFIYGNDFSYTSASKGTTSAAKKAEILGFTSGIDANMKISSKLPPSIQQACNYGSTGGSPETVVNTDAPELIIANVSGGSTSFDSAAQDCYY